MPAIRNFGYLWDRDRVYWGRGNQAGTLLGHHSKYGDVDFREQKGVYLLHTTDLKVVYIGQVGSGNQSLFDRLKQHLRSDELWNRWRYFSWFGWRGVNMTGERDARLTNHAGGSPKVSGAAEEFLDEVEAVLIQVTEPSLNRQGPIWRDTVQFKQVDDNRLQLSDLPAIAELQAELVNKLNDIDKKGRKRT